MIPPKGWWDAKQPMAGVEWHAPKDLIKGRIHAQDDFPHSICREVYIVVCVTHLNNIAGDDRDENLRARCQWCHLNADVFHHHITRATRKDQKRPIQWEAAIAI